MMLKRLMLHFPILLLDEDVHIDSIFLLSNIHVSSCLWYMVVAGDYHDPITSLLSS